MEWAAVLDTAKNVAALSAAVMAVVGIGTWRRDFSGKRNIELAEETLVLFYRARDAVRAMRSPGAFEHEFDHVVQKDGESLIVFQARKTIAPLLKRHEHYSELFASLQATRYRYMARFGNDAGAPFEELRLLVINVLLTARHYVMMSGQYDPNEKSPASERQRERLNEAESIFWEMGNDDEINRKLARIVETVESQCRGIIESQFHPRAWYRRWVKPLISRRAEKSVGN